MAVTVITASHLDVFIDLKRISYTTVVKAKVEIDTSPSIIRLGHSTCGKWRVLNATVLTLAYYTIFGVATQVQDSEKGKVRLSIIEMARY